MNTTSELIDRPAVADTAAPESTQASEAPRRGPAVTPAVDIVEDSEGITLWADLPGVSKAGLDLRVHDNRLTIDAQVSLPQTEGLRLQHAEWRAPRYLRSFVVSPHFDTARIEANLRDGLLTLRIPRRAEALPRKIEVATGTA
ncbi:MULTISPECIES: Hsp20/alpha crystallin family protein [Burkholderia]|uniref:Heat-shock protein n=1 Tax=Burkholderia gladioli TaxID=28095 RepID=A0A2A7S6F4_BURGA|nr:MULTISPECIES: Hsp20/alpha crystallin family protein [Burkholderia]ATF84885.1 heat-shock protein [Burkholderia gladioli pv. gladioli]MBJ9664846.1 Hsp20/alpha crystallin family protein [Burkholderia gladioli]MBU9168899.1 Hsp20/alpha crystallin family protein [Burkholderia gladioli]MBU9215572.1 Hsp20/alpha crystallin family protein [Burkholderia gladioli]MBU9380112.1 Hsp20/alpha crystallin family protein [Burkholderia gladioli]